MTSNNLTNWASSSNREWARRRFDPEIEDAIDGGAIDGDRALLSEAPPMSVDEAMRLLAMARGKPAGHRREAWRHPPKSLDEVRDSILRKLEAIERHDAREGRAA